MEVENKMLKDIESFVKDSIQKVVALTINGSLVRFDVDTNSNKPEMTHVYKLVYLKYETSERVADEDRLQFGIIQKGFEFIPREDVKEYVLKLLTDTSLLGIDIGIDISEIVLKFNYSKTLRLLDISQGFYNELFNKLYVKGESVNSSAISDMDQNILKIKFDALALNNYYDLINLRVFKYLKAASRSNSYLKFFEKTFNCFIPVFVKADGLFNPFLDAHKYKRLIGNSKLLEVSKKHVIDVKGVLVYYITHANFCECLHFNGYTKLTDSFALNILFGSVNRSFPNASTFVYFNPELKKPLSEEQFSELKDPNERSKFMRLSTLEIRCSRFYKLLGFSKSRDLYDIVKEASL